MMVWPGFTPQNSRVSAGWRDASRALLSAERCAPATLAVRTLSAAPAGIRPSNAKAAAVAIIARNVMQSSHDCAAVGRRFVDGILGRAWWRDCGIRPQFRASFYDAKDKCLRALEDPAAPPVRLSANCQIQMSA